MNQIEQRRRKFLQSGVVGFCIAFFAGLPKISFPKSSSNNDKGIVVHEDEGVHILTGRRKAPISIKISKAKHGVDRISFCTEDIIPGRKLRIHN
jgi:hypothetical protein